MNPATRFVERFLSASRKSLAFAGAAAVGCAVGALLGEPFLAFTRSGGGGTATCLLIDTSGSMEGKKIEEVREAAIAYARRQRFSSTQLALVSFDSSADLKVPLTGDRDRIVAGCRTLEPRETTNLAAGLRTAAAALDAAGSGSARSILVFTDGSPDSKPAALEAAREARSRGITIAAIRTHDADAGNELFREITGDATLVFAADTGRFGKAFEDAEKRLSLGDSSGGSWLYEALRFGIYSGLLALGIVLAVLVAQNAHVGKRWLEPDRLLAVAPAGFAAGLAGGAAASASFSLAQGVGMGLTALGGLGIPTLLVAGLVGWLLATFLPRGEAGWRPRSRLLAAAVAAAAVIGADWLASFNAVGGLVSALTSDLAQRPLGWTLLGALVAFGIAWIIPNLQADRATASGAVGGLCGGLAFVLLNGLLPDSPVARLTAAAVLGFFIGLAVAIVEAVFRDHWLEIRYGKGESRRVTLGREPVSIGSDEKRATVFARGAAGLAYRYHVADGRVHCENCETRRTAVVPVGDTKSAGIVTITVCGRQGGEEAGEAAVRSASQAAMGTLSLRIAERPPIRLERGALITAAEIPGLGEGGRELTVAEVVSDPSRPGVLGLRNRSSRAWKIVTPDGREAAVPPDKRLLIAAGTRIDFGSVKGVIG